MTRWLARLLAAIVIAAGLIPLTAGASWACSCATSTLTESQEWRAVAATASQIYLAEVVDRSGGTQVDAAGKPTFGGEYRYQLRVTATIKGAVSGTQYVTTSASGASCGVTLREDRPLLVYAKTLSLCGGGYTQDRVSERVAIIRAVLDPRGRPLRDPVCALDGRACLGTVHQVKSGEWLWKIARAEMLRQGTSSSSATAVRSYVAKVYRVNAAVIGRDANRLRVGTRLLLPPVR